MLSILIPTYNYNVVSLVQELRNQAENAGIVFEILVYDDASPNFNIAAENDQIKNFRYCRYEVLPSNIGRSAIRNLLAVNALYDWLLFLDADTLPITEKFIAGYLPYLNNEEKVVYGSIKYQPEIPPPDQLLRWIYGNKREALPKEIRENDPYRSMLTLNFAIRKSVFSKVKFNEDMPNLRCEDTFFSYELMKAGIRVEHISNEVYHLGLDTSEKFIQKSIESNHALTFLLKNNLMPANYVKIGYAYNVLASLGLKPSMAFLHSATKKLFLKNMLSKNPSLFIYDLYRLGYLCSLK